MRWFCGVLCSLVLCGVGFGQSVKLPDVTGDPGTIIVVKATTDCASLRWVVLDPGLSMIPPDLLKDSKTAVVMAGKAGKYRLLAYGAIKDNVSDPAICTVTVGEVPPGPNPPGPGPGPGPNPPAPIPTEGFRVLVIYETAELSKLPKGQADILASSDVREYLNQKCVVVSGTKEWRFFDKDVDVSKESSVWQGAMKLPRKSIPWIIISDGKTGTSESLPATIADTLTLLKKYGG